MARFSALGFLVTVFYFFVWATQVSTPLHSDISLRTIEFLPRVSPILTISAPPPIRSPCAGINRCDKSPIYKTWASRIVGSVNQARGYLNVRNFVCPYLLQVGRYLHQVTDMLGRPTPDSLLGLLVTSKTGKQVAPPLQWGRVETAPPPPPCPSPPPPPPPTRTLPVYFPLTPTSGPWNPPTPTTGFSRLRPAEPVVETDSDDWFQQATFIGFSLILTISSFVWSFMTALSSVGCVEHQDTENDGNASRCDAIRPVVPPTTESSATEVTQKSTIESSTETQQTRLDSPVTAHPESRVGETSNRTLDVVIWRSPSLVPICILPLAPLPFAGVSALASRRQLVTLNQLLCPNYSLNHINRMISPLVSTTRRVPLLLEWPITITEVRAEISTSLEVALVSTNTYYHEIPTVFKNSFDFLIGAWPTRKEPFRQKASLAERCALVLIEWYSTQSNTSYTHLIHNPTFDHTRDTHFPTPQMSLEWHALPQVVQSSDDEYHLFRPLIPQSYAHPSHIPTFDHTRDTHFPTPQMSLEWHALPQAAKSSGGEAKVAELEPSVATSVPIIQPGAPPKPKAPLHIPPSFHRYANIRLEDLDDQKLRHEIGVAEVRYRFEKPRRDRSRFRLRAMRSESEKKGERPLVRRKCKEQIEDEVEMERVMRARHLAKEEVFEGVGGPPRRVPDLLQDLFDTLKRECAERKKKERKGIMKKTEEVKKKGKKPKVVRWMDEIGRKLAR